MSDVVRIPARAPNGLLYANVVIQAVVLPMILWIQLRSEHPARLGWQIAAMSAAGLVGAVWLIARRRSPAFAILVDDRMLSIPGVLAGATLVPLSTIESATTETTRSAAETRSELRLHVKQRPPVRVSSRLVGADAVHATIDALRARGVNVA